MTKPDTEASREVKARERFHDRAISLLLATIWIGAALLVHQSVPEIPTSMLLIGTVFFILLVPAMKELVKVIDRRVKIQLGVIEPVDD